MRNIKIASVYVSHHSEDYINKFGSIHRAELGDAAYIVNSSQDIFTLNPDLDFHLINTHKNVGFSIANNIGIRESLKADPDYVLIINPDVCLPTKWLSDISTIISKAKYSDVGIFTVPLLGYDFEKDRSDGLIDSMGISHKWYGRWFDVMQGSEVSAFNRNLLPYEILAACGALMLIRKDIISDLLNSDGYVFNESYFMYKEDIELSIRTRRLGRKIMMLPSAPAYHCRGWAKDRNESPYWSRMQSARNELNMHLNFYWRFVPYSLLKYMYVRFIEK